MPYRCIKTYEQYAASFCVRVSTGRIIRVLQRQVRIRSLLRTDWAG